MKALSLTQPWAWLVIHGGKDVENRRWNTKFRGRFLVHAAKAMRAKDFDHAWDVARDISQGLAWRLSDEREKGSFLRGGIIGSVELVDVQPPLTAPQKALALEEWTKRSANTDQWHFHDQYGYRLRDPRPLPFHPCLGALGFWGEFEVRDGQVVQLKAPGRGGGRVRATEGA